MQILNAPAVFIHAYQAIWIRYEAQYSIQTIVAINYIKSIISGIDDINILIIN